jgi:MSHA biogenesis protein MshP
MNARGFALLPALFLIVIVALLGAVALRVVMAQQQTTVIALQQARALAAARAGIDWGAYQALHGSCAGGTLSLSEAALAGFTVTVTCAATAFTDGTSSYQSFTIAATASRGTYGEPDYVRRVVSATFTNDT